MDEPNVTDSLTCGESSEKENTDKHPFFLSTRFRLTLHIFFINTLMYMHRVNLSLAVVCMVDRSHWGLDLPPAVLNSSSNEHNSSYFSGNAVNVLVQTERLKNHTNWLAHDSFGTSTGEAEDGTCTEQADSTEGLNPELDWPKSQVSVLLSTYFYGCVLTQIPGGALADIFGGKHIVTVAMAITSACALLTPVCARTSIYLLMALRVLLGLGGGAIFPVGIAIITMWAPSHERPVIIALTASGSLFGAIVSYLTSGFLCAHGFDNGWPSIFYIHGMLAVLSLCLWIFDAASTPAEHPRISQAELAYIQTTNKSHSKTVSRRTPWKRLLVSRALWASCVTQLSFNWSFFTLLINVPLFLKEVLKFNVQQNGVFSALPYICTMVTIIASGKVSNIVIHKRLLRTLATRRVFTAASLLGSGLCLVLAGHLTCDLRDLSVTLLCLASEFFGMAWGGLFLNHPEFAGQYAGTALGITNCGGILAATIASMSAGLLTPNSTQSEWQTVFYIAASFNVLGTLVFSTCACAKLEPWAVPNVDITISLDGETKQMEPLNTTDS